jgi:hypothetical protein
VKLLSHFSFLNKSLLIFSIKKAICIFAQNLESKEFFTAKPQSTITFLTIILLLFLKESNAPFALFLFFFFFRTGVLTQGLHLEPLHQAYFCEGFFKIGSPELFAWAGFEPQSSCSLLLNARITGMSHRCLAALLAFFYECVSFYLPNSHSCFKTQLEDHSYEATPNSQKDGLALSSLPIHTYTIILALN